MTRLMLVAAVLLGGGCGRLRRYPATRGGLDVDVTGILGSRTALGRHASGDQVTSVTLADRDGLILRRL